MGSKLIREFCWLDSASEGMLQMAMTELRLSARAYDRILKVARAIADLEGADTIAALHVAEAIQYCTRTGNLWAQGNMGDSGESAKEAWPLT